MQVVPQICITKTIVLPSSRHYAVKLESKTNNQYITRRAMNVVMVMTRLHSSLLMMSSWPQPELHCCCPCVLAWNARSKVQRLGRQCCSGTPGVDSAVPAYTVTHLHRVSEKNVPVLFLE